MQNIPSVSALHHFHFGQRIHCTDGEAGLLTQVVFDPASHRVISLGILLGHVFGRIVPVAFATVASATEGCLMLRLSRAELAASRKAAPAGAVLDHTSVVETAPTREAAPKRMIRLIAVHPESGDLAYLVAHSPRSRQQTLFCGKDVTGIKTGHISIALLETVVQTLPPYHPDRELQRAIEQRLSDLTPFHIDFRGMQIRVVDSVLYLTGNISSSLSKDIIEDQALGVQGVGEIKNDLLGDDTLANTLALALDRDPRTHALLIGVYPRLGHVRLSGSVHTEQQKAAAEEIARHFPGVRSVTNTLVVNPKEAMLRAMAAVSGEQGEDLIPGKYVRHTT